MQRSQNKWSCESIEIHTTEITDTHFKEILERVWELLQSQERQPVRIFRPEMLNEFVEDPVKHYRRSA